MISMLHSGLSELLTDFEINHYNQNTVLESTVLKLVWNLTSVSHINSCLWLSQVKGTVCIWAYFCGIKWVGILLLPLDWMLIHCNCGVTSSMKLPSPPLTNVKFVVASFCLIYFYYSCLIAPLKNVHDSQFFPPKSMFMVFVLFCINPRLLTGSLDQENPICRPQKILEILSSPVRFWGRNTRNLSCLLGLENICSFNFVSLVHNCYLSFLPNYLLAYTTDKHN